MEFNDISIESCANPEEVAAITQIVREIFTTGNINDNIGRLVAVLNNLYYTNPNADQPTTEDNKAGSNLRVKFVNDGNEFLGVVAYPDIAGLTEVLNILSARSLVKLSTAYHKDICEKMSFVVEIDEKIFDRTYITFNPEEISEMIIIALSVARSNIISGFFEAFRERMDVMAMMETKTISRLIGMFYVVPFFTMLKAYTLAAEFNDEILASKLHHMFGNTLCDPTVGLHEAETDMIWCNLNIVDISRRRAMLHAELFNRAARAKGFSRRKIYLTLSARCGIGLKDKYTNATLAMESVVAEADNTSIPEAISKVNFVVNPAIESAVNANYGVAMESLFRKNTPTMPTDFALDEISIEIDKIENQMDRSYVLDLIYQRLDQLDMFEKASVEKGDYYKYDAKVKSKREYLYKLRQAVLDKKVVEKRYGVFVKCPVGYEG